jgi:tetratricopeptide (TPR) repeat protein
MKAAAILLWAAMQAADPAALSDQAQQLAMKQRFAEAEALWKQALELAPGYFPALFNLGYMHYSREQFDRAVPYLERAAKAEPEDFNTRYLLGVTLSRLGRRDEALRSWRAALAINPKHVKLLQIAAVEYAAGQYYQEAAEAARRALDLDASDPNGFYLAIKSYQDAGNTAAALEVAERAAGKFPDQARANFEYGFQLQKIGRIEEAEPYLKKAIELDASYEEPFFFYGDILVKQDRNQEAIPALERAIRNRPDYMAARVSLGRAYMGLERFEEAIRELEEALRLAPEHPQPHLILSQVYFRMGDEEKARHHRELSLQYRRENPEAMEAKPSRPFPAGP